MQNEQFHFPVPWVGGTQHGGGTFQHPLTECLHSGTIVVTLWETEA